MENKKMYGFWVAFSYKIDRISFELFGSNHDNVLADASLNYNKKLEEFVIDDYMEIKEMIAKNITQNINKQKKEVYAKMNKENDYKEENDIITKDSITILNIIPKKYEELKKYEKD